MIEILIDSIDVHFKQILVTSDPRLHDHVYNFSKIIQIINNDKYIIAN